VSDFKSYDELKWMCRKLMAEGKLPTEPTLEQKIDFVYGNLAIDRPGLDRAMVERVVRSMHEYEPVGGGAWWRHMPDLGEDD
jgi:hypothetical protein